jgi:predicted phosphodiesterase
MLIQYLSDIHLEFMTKPPKIKAMADVLCLCGDIGYPHSGIYSLFLKQMSQSFKKVFLITGNHEYYNSDKYGSHTMEEINRHIGFIINVNKLENVTFLNNSYELYDDVLFVGTTLWSKIPSMNMNDICLMNDFKQIEGLTYDTYNLLHYKSCSFIADTLALIEKGDIFKDKNVNIKVVIMTHHLPSFNLIDEKHAYSDTNCFYASKCDPFFVEPIKAWIYGHTHTPNKTIINNIKFVCNPKGYPSENTVVKYETITV